MDLEELLPPGFVLVGLYGQSEFPVFGSDGVPTGDLMAFAVQEPLNEAGTEMYCRFIRKMAEEELDAVPLRSSDGTVKAITYGEYRRSLKESSV